MKHQKIEFTLPPGYSVPRGTMPGDHFEELAKFELKPDGRACLVEIAEIQLPGYEDKDQNQDQNQDRNQGQTFTGRVKEEMGREPSGDY